MARKLRLVAAGVAAVAAFTSAVGVRAQVPFSENFEGGTAGNFVSGFNGWYLPASGGRDFKIYSYVGNDLNAPGDIRTIPAAFGGGGSVFISGNSVGATLGRAQHTNIP